MSIAEPQRPSLGPSVRNAFTGLLVLADAGLLTPYWSPGVLAEIRRNLVSDRFGVEPAKADRMLAAMGKAFPMAQVNGYAKHEPKFAGFFDAKDVRVAAAAYKLSLGTYGGAPVVLVSSNLKDFPQSGVQRDHSSDIAPGNDRIMRR